MRFYFASEMKKLLAFILLISHINFSMFIAQVDETDAYDKNGQQIDDINSLAEYISALITKDHHSSKKDEDDDNARYFHIEKQDTYCFNQMVVSIKRPAFNLGKKTCYPPYIQHRITPVFSEIQSPPPEV